MDQLVAFLPMIIALVLIYFLMIRPQKKREKEVQKMRSALEPGDEVLTVGGIKGVITKAGEDYITLESSGHTRIEFTRNAIYKVLNDKEPTPSEDQAKDEGKENKTEEKTEEN